MEVTFDFRVGCVCRNEWAEKQRSRLFVVCDVNLGALSADLSQSLPTAGQWQRFAVWGRLLLHVDGSQEWMETRLGKWHR